jgi:hypothetical protein
LASAKPGERNAAIAALELDPQAGTLDATA